MNNKFQNIYGSISYFVRAAMAMIFAHDPEKAMKIFSTKSNLLVIHPQQMKFDLFKLLPSFFHHAYRYWKCDKQSKQGDLIAISISTEQISFRGHNVFKLDALDLRQQLLST